MPFQSKPTHAFKVRVVGSESAAIRSAGTSDPDTADEVEAMVRLLKRRRRWDALDPVVRGDVPLKALFDAYQRDRLDAFVAELGDVDVTTLVPEWALTASPRYVKQVRDLLGDTAIPASRFTRRTVSALLAGLPHSGSTKNRYRAALSAFAKWLVEREVLETNPVRDVAGFKENGPRDLWLTAEQVKALVNAQSGQYRVIGALMAGAGLEWQAVARVQRRDVDLDARTVHAHGSKTTWRNRVVRITEDWAFAIVSDWCRSLLPTARLVTVSHSKAHRAHVQASHAAKVPVTTLHDHRHSYTVQKLKDGWPPHLIRRQLGHAPSSRLVETTYGRFIPDADDYARAANKAGSSTTSATAPSTKRRANAR